MDTNSISLFSNTHAHVARRTDIRSIIFSAVLILVGALAFYLSIKEEKESSSLSMLVMTVGTAMILVGVFRLFWKSQAWFYTPSQSKIVVKSEFYDASDFVKLKRVLENASFSESKNVKASNTGGIRMDYMFSKDRKFVAVQLYQFSSYIYQPVTEVFYYKDNAADRFIDCAGRRSF